MKSAILAVIALCASWAYAQTLTVVNKYVYQPFYTEFPSDQLPEQCWQYSRGGSYSKPQQWSCYNTNTVSEIILYIISLGS